MKKLLLIACFLGIIAMIIAYTSVTLSSVLISLIGIASVIVAIMCFHDKEEILFGFGSLFGGLCLIFAVIAFNAEKSNYFALEDWCKIATIISLGGFILTLALGALAQLRKYKI